MIQICYRAADLGYLLDLEESKLSDYSEWLRRDKDVDYSGTGLPISINNPQRGPARRGNPTGVAKQERGLGDIKIFWQDNGGKMI
jgi:hypothetical protein